MSCFVITIRGVAPSTWLLLILEPVTVTFSRVTTPSSDSAGASSSEDSDSVSTGASSTTSSETASVSSETTISPGLSATTTKEIVKIVSKKKFFISLIIKLSP